jgi:hypothetical protein
MDLAPSNQKLLPMFGNDFHSPPDITELHAFGPNQLGPNQIEFDLAMPKYMHMGRLVIIDNNDNPQAFDAIYRNHTSS